MSLRIMRKLGVCASCDFRVNMMGALPRKNNRSKFLMLEQQWTGVFFDATLKSFGWAAGNWYSKPRLGASARNQQSKKSNARTSTLSTAHHFAAVVTIRHRQPSQRRG